MLSGPGPSGCSRGCSFFFVLIFAVCLCSVCPLAFLSSLGLPVGSAISTSVAGRSLDLAPVVGSLAPLLSTSQVALTAQPTVSTGITRVEAPDRLPDDAVSQGVVETGQLLTARLDPLQQHTWKYQGSVGERITVTVSVQTATLYVFVGLYDSNGQLISRTVNMRTSQDRMLTETLPSDSLYTILVGGWGGSFGTYSIQVLVAVNPTPTQLRSFSTFTSIPVTATVTTNSGSIPAQLANEPAAAPISASNDFMNALIAKDYIKAYGMIHPSQRTSFGGSPEGMQQLFADKGLEPSSFTFANVQVGTDALVNGTGTFGGNSKYLYVSLRKDGDTWKILGLDVNNNPPTQTPVVIVPVTVTAATSTEMNAPQIETFTATPSVTSSGNSVVVQWITNGDSVRLDRISSQGTQTLSSLPAAGEHTFSIDNNETGQITLRLTAIKNGQQVRKSINVSVQQQ